MRLLRDRPLAADQIPSHLLGRMRQPLCSPSPHKPGAATRQLYERVQSRCCHLCVAQHPMVGAAVHIQKGVPAARQTPALGRRAAERRRPIPATLLLPPPRACRRFRKAQHTVPHACRQRISCRRPLLMLLRRGAPRLPPPCPP